MAISYDVLLRVPDAPKARYSGPGFYFGARHGSFIWMLPIRATHAIDRESSISNAFVEPDFTIRHEPADIVAAVRTLFAGGPAVGV